MVKHKYQLLILINFGILIVNLNWGKGLALLVSEC